MTITVRQATFLDFGALWSLKVEMLKQFTEVTPRVTAFGLGILAHQANGWLLDRDTAVFLAFEGETAVGFAVVHVGGVMQCGDEMVLTGAHLWVRPEWAWTDAGMKLALRARTVAKNLKAKAIQFIARADNPHFRSLAEAHHFRPIGVVYERRFDDAT